MTAPDFAAFLFCRNVPPSLLNEVVPELCQTCGGAGKVSESFGPMTRGFRVNDCPDCPTIAKLLAIGAAVLSIPTDPVPRR